MFGPMMVATLLVAMCAVEWLRWYRNDPPHPILYSCAAVAGVAYAFIRTRHYLAQLRTRHFSGQGERRTGRTVRASNAAGTCGFRCNWHIGSMFGLGAGWADVPTLNLLMGVPLKVSAGRRL